VVKGKREYEDRRGCGTLPPFLPLSFWPPFDFSGAGAQPGKITGQKSVGERQGLPPSSFFPFPCFRNRFRQNPPACAPGSKDGYTGIEFWILSNGISLLSLPPFFGGGNKIHSNRWASVLPPFPPFSPLLNASSFARRKPACEIRLYPKGRGL